MPALHSDKYPYEFAVIRLVPRVERAEFINVGVIVFCLGLKRLQCRIDLDLNRLSALHPEMDLNSIDEIQQHLSAFTDICEGTRDAGPIALLTQRERFHWLVAARSTVIQISPVHSGICECPENALNDLFERLVL